MSIRKLLLILSFILIFIAGAVGGYLYFMNIKDRDEIKGSADSLHSEVLVPLKIYYPLSDELLIEERMIPKRIVQTSSAEAVIEQFLKGPAGIESHGIPRNTKLLGVYRGMDKVLYVDISDEFRRNFQGDVLAEFLLLKGLYESLISNVEDIQDVKILIEGQEIETLGGHFYLKYPLKDTVSIEIY